MMNDGAIARSVFHRLEVFAGGKLQRNHEAAVVVPSLGGQLVRLRHLQDHVGLAKLPAIGKLRWRRPISRVALRSTSLDPTVDELDLLFAEPALVGEWCRTRLCLPRGHAPLPGDSSDQLGPFADVAV